MGYCSARWNGFEKEEMKHPYPDIYSNFMITALFLDAWIMGA